ncbi:MAG: flagellar basal body rod C-terminal domain-containing protein [Desulfobacteraceae bacterium]|jgi:flagellar basal-body rod protein FlgC|nr:flagellar basal body rod C-terminal domain-containing protein [Desulfobacteraceae bacterium]
MVPAINGTLSALQAYKKSMGVTAHNIANVNTEGFKKSRGTMHEGVNGSVEAAVSKANTAGHRYQELDGDQMVAKETSNVNLEEELPDLMVTQRTYEANLKVLQTRDKMLGTTLDILG